MKYCSLILVFLLLFCSNKEDILLPKSNVTVVANVEDHSPIYIFFRTKGNDTLAEVNRKNEIISTNWIFNIDKRLPLRLVIPEVLKLQEKKRNEKAHKNEAAQNYYSYADSIGKNLAFLPFTKVHYKMEKSDNISFKKNGLVQFQNQIFSKNELPNFLNSLFKNQKSIIVFSYDRNMSFGEYVQDKILLENLKINNTTVAINHNKEFIY